MAKTFEDKAVSYEAAYGILRARMFVIQECLNQMETYPEQNFPMEMIKVVAKKEIPDPFDGKEWTRLLQK